MTSLDDLMKVVAELDDYLMNEFITYADEDPQGKVWMEIGSSIKLDQLAERLHEELEKLSREHE